jgi:hypothetical protein
MSEAKYGVLERGRPAVFVATAIAITIPDQVDSVNTVPSRGVNRMRVLLPST